MGVMKCDRNDCENTLCSTLIENDYICDECKQEFRDLLGEEQLPYSEMLDKFNEFMKTPKLAFPRNIEVTAEDFFSMHSPNKEDDD